MASLECLDEGTLSSASSVPASQPPTRQVSLFAQPAIRYRAEVVLGKVLRKKRWR
ncbi:unnamed protein product [Ixodes persulcatus]